VTSLPTTVSENAENANSVTQNVNMQNSKPPDPVLYTKLSDNTIMNVKNGVVKPVRNLEYSDFVSSIIG
jgi:hypothetical protein